MSNYEISEADKERIAADYRFENVESFQAFIQEEIKKAFAEGSLDSTMAQVYGVHRRGR